MAAQRTTSTWVHLILYLGLGLLLLLLVGLSFTNYTALLALLGGIILAWPARLLFHSIRDVARRQKWPKWIWLLSIPMLTLILLCWLISLILLGTGQEGTISQVSVYRVIIEPTDPGLNQFKLKEEINFSPEEPNSPLGQDLQIQLPRRTITPVERGWLLREVEIKPPPSITLELSDGTLTSTLLIYSDTQSSVELRDIPQKAFYAARDARNVQTYPYLDNETVSWSTLNAERGIVFAYIQPPYQRFRGVLKPFLGASSVWEWLLGLLGLVVTGIVAPVAKAVFYDTVEEKVKAWLERLFKRKKPPAPKEGPSADSRDTKE